ncbi:BAD_collapsed_G0038060.mRNA.1.CDS.1 [Saccharomyces cerevisiae]|nr:BAD_collapsed_G0038060.mRNA.1.CDS.1 [Saccharomyces cerevisiae]
MSNTPYNSSVPSIASMTQSSVSRSPNMHTATTPGANTSSNSPPLHMSSDSSKIKRKRNRIPLSCTICRKRKVKCDKLRPHCQQCTKTGVAHLCHYMEQTWAEEAEKELLKDNELKKLRERVKSLEKTLSKVHSSPSSNSLKSYNTPESSNLFMGSDEHTTLVNANTGSASSASHMHQQQQQQQQQEQQHDFSRSANANANSSSLSISNKYDNDELDLTKDFDLLHIKSNGTIHLGATHWLSIMKGDPYLKLLWGHIFAMREKLNEWYYQKNSYSKLKSSKCPINHAQAPPSAAAAATRKCPVDHSAFSSGMVAPKEETPLPRKCPVDHTMFSSGMIPPREDTSSQKRCPVDHTMYSAGMMPPKDETPSPFSTKAMIDHNKHTMNPPQSKCPVDHRNYMKDYPSDMANSSSNPASRCPIDHSSMKNTAALPASTHNTIPHHQPQSGSHARSHPAQSRKHDSYMTESEVLATLCEMLPPKRVIALFIEKFFKHLYPAIPILDEQNFKNHVNQMVSLSSMNPTVNNFGMSMPSSSTLENQPITQINLPKLSDSCNLGILIIILRLTWLSIPSNSCKVDLGEESGSFLVPNESSNMSASALTSMAKEESLLLKHETPVEALELCQKYLIKFDELSSISNNNVNLTTVQFAIFYNFYMKSASNDLTTLTNTNNTGMANPGHDSESHQILLSNITQMAFSCGLHRDPDNFPQLNATIPATSQDVSNNGSKKANPSTNPTLNNNMSAATTNSSSRSGSADSRSGSNPVNKKENQVSIERFKHTWRKIWYYIVSMDVNQSLSLGSPRLLRNLRDFSDTKLPSASRIDYVRDIKELIIVKNFTLFFQIDLCIIAVLNHILNVSLARSVRKFELDSLINLLKNLTYGTENVNDVVSSLINKGLLPTSEGGSVDSNNDEIYGLPKLPDILNHGQHNQNLYADGRNTSSSDIDKKLDLPHESTTRALFFSKHMTIRMLLYLLNYILFTHYEPMGSEDPGTNILAKEYAQEALNFAMDGYRNCMIFFNNIRNTNSLFDYMNVILSYPCLDIGHRSLQFIVCLILRARCGPLTGMRESSIITNGTSSGFNSSVEDEDVKVKQESSDELKKDDFMKDVNLDSGDSLAEILMSRMLLFQKLTKQLSKKYNYAIRMNKSTGFFVSLLDTPSKKSDSKSGGSSFMLGNWKHPKVSNMSGFLAGDKDQLQKCPVYQDALGFVSPTGANEGSAPMQGMSLQGSTARMGGTQLPPIRSYKPITYTSSNLRRMNETGEAEAKKRRFNDGYIDNNSNNDIPRGISPKPSNGLSSVQPLLSSFSMNQLNGGTIPTVPSLTNITSQMGALPSLDRITTNQINLPDPSRDEAFDNSVKQMTPMTSAFMNANTTIPGSTLNGNMNMNGAGTANTDTSANGSALSTLTSPQGSDLASNSATQYKPDLEDFLMQNSNFNGLMINPSSLVEVVGGYNDPNNLGRNDAVDFLPVDNVEIDGLVDFYRADFPIWE